MQQATARAVQLLPVDMIDVGERLREIIDDYVQMLAESIREIGLTTPIEVREVPGGRYRLVAGGHRYAACRAIGRTEIEAFIVDVDDLGARLREIDENLVRHELNPLDRGRFLFERKTIFEAMHPETKRGVPGALKKHGAANDIVSFAETTALAAGYSQRAIQRAIAMYAALSPAVRDLLRASPIARDQSELIRISRLPAKDQVKVVRMLRDPAKDAPRKVAAALAMLTGRRAEPQAPADKKFQTLVAAYDRAGPRAQRAFVAWLRESGEIAKHQQHPEENEG